MLRGGRPFGTLHADQQQYLIPAIGNRVTRLRQHRAGAGPQRGDTFGNRDGTVRGERVEDRFY
jgi:hypothetical protein